ncbi:hypothetical protein KQI84_08110 [bacterium]|nr:hypothetical protein [bacterium]
MCSQEIDTRPGTFEEIPIWSRVKSLALVRQAADVDLWRIVILAATYYYQYVVRHYSITIPRKQQPDVFFCLTYLDWAGDPSDPDIEKTVCPNLFFSKTARDTILPNVKLQPVVDDELPAILRPDPDIEYFGAKLRVYAAELPERDPELRRLYIGFPRIPGAGFLNLQELVPR